MQRSFPQNFKDAALIVIFRIVFNKKSSVNSLLLCMKCLFSLPAFKISSSLLVFSSSILTRLAVVFFRCLVLAVYGASRICSFHNIWGKTLSHHFTNTFLCPSSSSFRNTSFTHVRMMILFYFGGSFSFCFTLDSFYCCTFRFTNLCIFSV